MMVTDHYPPLQTIKPVLGILKNAKKYPIKVRIRLVIISNPSTQQVILERLWSWELRYRTGTLAIPSINVYDSAVSHLLTQ